MQSLVNVVLFYVLVQKKRSQLIDGMAAKLCLLCWVRCMLLWSTVCSHRNSSSPEESVLPCFYAQKHFLQAQTRCCFAEITAVSKGNLRAFISALLALQIPLVTLGSVSWGLAVPLVSQWLRRTSKELTATFLEKLFMLYSNVILAKHFLSMINGPPDKNLPWPNWGSAFLSVFLTCSQFAIAFFSFVSQWLPW